MTTIAGFFLASHGHIDLGLLLAALVGLSLIIGSACVFNNYLDRDIDALMARTKKRALASGAIPTRTALTYASLLGIIGAVILAKWTNSLALSLALFGFFAYVVVYGIAKRRTVYGTVIGSISGAIPPVAGYAAVSHHLDATAGMLFLILVLWQMPHFYAIAMYRLDDYAAAKLPVWPVKKGLQATKVQIIAYIITFTVAAALLTAFGHTGYIYLSGVVLVGLVWLIWGLRGFGGDNDKLWARHMFLFSLIVITVFSLLVTADAWLV